MLKNTKLYNVIRIFYRLRIYPIILDFKVPNPKIMYGLKNKKNKFYVIRLDEIESIGTDGLFAHFLMNIKHLAYADRKKWIPVVDMRSYKNAYLEEAEVNRINAWEYYFKQVSEYSLDEVYSSKNVYEIPTKPYNRIKVDLPFTPISIMRKENNQLEIWRKIRKKYISFQDNIQEEIDKEFEKLFSENDKVLGVLCRGTDYLALKPSGHAIQPQPIEVIEKAKEVMEIYGCNKIYLSTEDIKILEMFKAKFKNQLVHVEREYIDYDGRGLVAEYATSRNSKYYNGLVYLKQITILSMCDCLIAGQTAGSMAALVLADDFDYTYFWDLGVYD